MLREPKNLTSVDLHQWDSKFKYRLVVYPVIVGVSITHKTAV